MSKLFVTCRSKIDPCRSCFEVLSELSFVGWNSASPICWMFLVEFDEKWWKFRKKCNLWDVSCWMRWKMKKISEIMQFVGCFLLNAIKNEENFGDNAISWMFLVKFDKKWRKFWKKCNLWDVSCWMRWKMKKIKENNAIF